MCIGLASMLESNNATLGFMIDIPDLCILSWVIGGITFHGGEPHCFQTSTWTIVQIQQASDMNWLNSSLHAYQLGWSSKTMTYLTDKCNSAGTTMRTTNSARSPNQALQHQANPLVPSL